MKIRDYELASPAESADWRAYHDIRRRVLFDARGTPYDEKHPDEHASGNHPLLLRHRGAAVGVVRIDVESETAFFRRVAIDVGVQRRGHGRVLLALAEQFARERACTKVTSYVAPDAVEFYQKCGYSVDVDSALAASGRAAVLMAKSL